MQHNKYDIIIFGSGVVGLTAAASLMSHKLKIALVDKESKANIRDQNDQRAFALAHGSKIYLNKKKLWQVYDHNTCPIKEIHVMDGYDTDYLEFNQKDIGSPLGLMLSASLIRQKLYQHLNEHGDNIDFYHDFTCSDIKYKQNSVDLTTKELTLSAKLLIAADGRNSKIRNDLALKTHFHDYQQTALAATISHQNHHKNIAVERFLTNGPFAMLPLQNGYKTSIVWTETKNEAAKILALPHSEIENILAEKTKNYLSTPKLEHKLQSFPLNLVYAPQNNFHRTILIGDAAHGMHPLAGQGFNVALRDIKIIDEILLSDKINLSQDCGRAELIKKFYQERKFDILSLVSSTHGINFIFSNNNIILKKTRKIGLKLADRIPALKFMMLRKAAGL